MSEFGPNFNPDDPKNKINPKKDEEGEAQGEQGTQGAEAQEENGVIEQLKIDVEEQIGFECFDDAQKIVAAFRGGNFGENNKDLADMLDERIAILEKARGCRDGLFNFSRYFDKIKHLSGFLESESFLNVKNKETKNEAEKIIRDVLDYIKEDFLQGSVRNSNTIEHLKKFKEDFKEFGDIVQAIDQRLGELRGDDVAEEETGTLERQGTQEENLNTEEKEISEKITNIMRETTTYDGEMMALTALLSSSDFLDIKDENIKTEAERRIREGLSYCKDRFLSLINIDNAKFWRDRMKDAVEKKSIIGAEEILEAAEKKLAELNTELETINKLLNFIRGNKGDDKEVAEDGTVEAQGEQVTQGAEAPVENTERTETEEAEEELKNWAAEFLERAETDEQEKKKYDPVWKFVKDKGLDPEEFNFYYKTVAKIEPDPEEEGYVLGTFKNFDNYHDLLDFRNKLSEEQKEKMDGQEWKGGWHKIAVFANDFWDRLANPEDELYKYKDEFHELYEKIKNEEIEDEYARKKDEQIKEEQAKKHDESATGQPTSEKLENGLGAGEATQGENAQGIEGEPVSAEIWRGEADEKYYDEKFAELEHKIFAVNAMAEGEEKERLFKECSEEKDELMKSYKDFCWMELGKGKSLEEIKPKYGVENEMKNEIKFMDPEKVKEVFGKQLEIIMSTSEKKLHPENDKDKINAILAMGKELGFGKEKSIWGGKYEKKVLDDLDKIKEDAEKLVKRELYFESLHKEDQGKDEKKGFIDKTFDKTKGAAKWFGRLSGGMAQTMLTFKAAEMGVQWLANAPSVVSAMGASANSAVAIGAASFMLAGAGLYAGRGALKFATESWRNRGYEKQDLSSPEAQEKVKDAMANLMSLAQMERFEEKANPELAKDKKNFVEQKEQYIKGEIKKDEWEKILDKRAQEQFGHKTKNELFRNAKEKKATILLEKKAIERETGVAKKLYEAVKDNPKLAEKFEKGGFLEGTKKVSKAYLKELGTLAAFEVPILRPILMASGGGQEGKEFIKILFEGTKLYENNPKTRKVIETLGWTAGAVGMSFAFAPNARAGERNSTKTAGDFFGPVKAYAETGGKAGNKAGEGGNWVSGKFEGMKQGIKEDWNMVKSAKEGKFFENWLNAFKARHGAKEKGITDEMVKKEFSEAMEKARKDLSQAERRELNNQINNIDTTKEVTINDLRGALVKDVKTQKFEIRGDLIEDAKVFNAHREYAELIDKYGDGTFGHGALYDKIKKLDGNLENFSREDLINFSKNKKRIIAEVEGEIARHNAKKAEAPSAVKQETAHLKTETPSAAKTETAKPAQEQAQAPKTEAKQETGKSQAPTAKVETKVQPSAPVMEKMTVEVKKGDTIWNISEEAGKKLGIDISTKGNLSLEQRAKNIFKRDAIKDEIVKQIKNPNSIKKGQEIKIDMVKVKEGLEQRNIITKAENLSGKDVKNILDYNKGAVKKGKIARKEDGVKSKAEILNAEKLKNAKKKDLAEAQDLAEAKNLADAKKLSVQRKDQVKTKSENNEQKGAEKQKAVESSVEEIKAKLERGEDISFDELQIRLPDVKVTEKMYKFHLDTWAERRAQKEFKILGEFKTKRKGKELKIIPKGMPDSEITYNEGQGKLKIGEYEIGKNDMASYLATMEKPAKNGEAIHWKADESGRIRMPESEIKSSWSGLYDYVLRDHKYEAQIGKENVKYITNSRGELLPGQEKVVKYLLDHNYEIGRGGISAEKMGHCLELVGREIQNDSERQIMAKFILRPSAMNAMQFAEKSGFKLPTKVDEVKTKLDGDRVEISGAYFENNGLRIPKHKVKIYFDLAEGKFFEKSLFGSKFFNTAQEYRQHLSKKYSKSFGIFRDRQ